MLKKQFPTIAAVSTEIINLMAILELPKGTEHFMSDLHGESEAFDHILHNASGVIRGKIDRLYSDDLSEEERGELATLIYYPRIKLELLKEKYGDNKDKFLRTSILRLIEISRVVSSKYTRSKVRKALPLDFAYIIDELLHADNQEGDKYLYYESIVRNIVSIGRAEAFIVAISDIIKRLSVDHLHIVGDVYDRGPGAEVIMDRLMAHHSVDIQWGNHDILWMGAAAGSYACIASVLNVSLKYGNVDTIENGYGISLRLLTNLAVSTYDTAPSFMPSVYENSAGRLEDASLIARIRKAIAVIQLKCEAQLISRHPEYGMDDRRILDRIDYSAGTLEIDGTVHKLKENDFPTIDPENPFALTEEEELVMKGLQQSFTRSMRLQSHVRFMFEKGSLYKCFNNNLLYHACVPLAEDGSFAEFVFDGEVYSGKALLDYCDSQARRAYFSAEGSPEKQKGEDFCWYLWCGKQSPLFGRECMTTFERLLIADKTTHEEPKNPYYKYIDDEKTVEMILSEFGLEGKDSHIVNGHMPVKYKDGDTPIKANGRLLMIDGGFSKAYQATTGIAGYTLIYNSFSLRLVAHQPFASVISAIEENIDIHSTSNILEETTERKHVADTDIGKTISQQVEVLKALLLHYQREEMQ